MAMGPATGLPDPTSQKLLDPVGQVSSATPQTMQGPFPTSQNTSTSVQSSPAPDPYAPTDTYRNNFLSSTYTAPYYNATGVAANVGTMLGQAAPGASNFLQQTFNPSLNTFEQAFLGAGLGNALTTQEQGFNRQEAQFENTPFHSGLNQAQGDVMNQTSRDLMSIAGQMGMQRQQLAGSMVQYPFEGALQAAMVGPQMSERMYNLANNAFSQPQQTAMQVWSGVPVPSPAVITGGQSGGGKSIV